LALDHLRSLLDSFLQEERFSGVAGHIGAPAMTEDAPHNRIQVVLTDLGRYRGDCGDLANLFASRVRNSKSQTRSLLSCGILHSAVAVVLIV
jgi:hypothetical protein